ncbi:putative quinol monooxygenase [Burkholderia sp. PU8-34]
MIYVLAFITTLPGHRDEVLAAYRTNTTPVRAENGCIEYVAAFDPANIDETPVALGPDSFVIVEKWDDFSCLQAHRVSPHMVEYGAKVKHLIAKRVVHVLSPVDAVA